MPVPLRVLSLNVYMMGHIPYQQTLENTFHDHFSEVHFESVHVLERVPTDFPLRLLLRLSRVRLPGCAPASDFDYLRFRFELGMSCVTRLMIARELRKARYDVIHLHTQAIALLASIPPLPLPYVLSIDNTTALFGRDRPAHPRHALAPLLAAERRCFRKAAHVISWSERARSSVIHDYGLPGSSVTAIPPGNPLPSHWFAKPEIKHGGGRIRLLFVGNDFERKGGMELLEAFHREFSASCELHIVSNGAPEVAPGGSVYVHRSLAPLSAELLEQYRLADLFVMPTREDCFPMVFIEAMAASLPCIGSTVMGVPELVLDGVTGFTPPANDSAALANALRRLVNDPSLRARMGAAGRTRVETQFDPVRTTSAILDVFQNATRTPRESKPQSQD